MLTTVAACKAFRNIPTDNTEHDDELRRLIVAGQEWLERECRRTFEQATFTEVYSGSAWRTRLLVKNPPITSITNIWDDPARIYATPLDPSKYAIADADAGEIRLDGLCFMRGLNNIKVTYIGGFPDGSPELDVLESALIEMVWAARMKGDQNLVGVRSRSLADANMQFLTLDWGSIAMDIVNKFSLKTGVA